MSTLFEVCAGISALLVMSCVLGLNSSDTYVETERYFKDELLK